MHTQLTNQGTLKIKAYFKDKLSNTVWFKEINRSFLAKMYHEQRVVGVIKGIPVIEV